ncbi:conserved Plasmodium protein, unknown function [Plasmodium ovale curtisi]|uniref:Uncharacterized protein n=1 Tax=Plasmodium ovale curtisi TaxID=864141 RepID=A0A1A8VJN4_PLAOA|nr:conserved Plasmodium protein, unknown function [Plasmodium ovale curtisi]
MYRRLKPYVFYLTKCDIVKNKHSSKSTVVLKKCFHICKLYKCPYEEAEGVSKDKFPYCVVEREKIETNDHLVWINSSNESVIDSSNGQNDNENKVQVRIENILSKYKRRKINDVITDVLSVVHSNTTNKDIYINRRLLLPFYSILLRKKYYKRNIQNDVYSNCSMTIFDYIHYNVKTHLKKYKLQNIHVLLKCLSKYIHKNKPNDITNELICNIFRYSFFSHLNTFNAYNEKSRIWIDDKSRNVEKYFFLSSSSNGSFRKEEKKMRGGNTDKSLQNIYHNEDKRWGKKQHLAYLNSYVVFLSNHPIYVSDKILYSISMLAQKIIQIDVGPKIALSYLSASLNIFRKQKKEKHCFFINKKGNYYILYTILRQLKEGKKESHAGGMFKNDNNSNVQVKEEQSEDEKLVEEKENLGEISPSAFSFKETSPCEVSPNERRKRRRIRTDINAEEEFPTLWNYAHLMHIVNILKLKNFISPQFTLAEDAEECITNTMLNMFNLMNKYISRLKNKFALISQNEFNSFISIYIQISILLSELQNYKLFFPAFRLLSDAHDTIRVHHNNLNINMLIHLVKGIYHQVCTYWGLLSSRSCFEDWETSRYDPLPRGTFERDIPEKEVHNEMHNGMHTSLHNALHNSLRLVKDISNCLLFPGGEDKEEGEFRTNKLITVLHYMHKMYKLFPSDMNYNVLKGQICIYIREIEQTFHRKKFIVYLSNSHVLIFLNIYLHHNSQCLHFPLISICLNCLVENENRLYKEEMEMIMFFNAVYRLRKVRENRCKEWHSTTSFPCVTSSKGELLSYDIHDDYYRRGSAEHGYHGDHGDYVECPEEEKTFLFAGKNGKENSIEDVDECLKKFADRIMQILFFSSQKSAKKKKIHWLSEGNLLLSSKKGDKELEKLTMRKKEGGNLHRLLLPCPSNRNDDNSCGSFHLVGKFPLKVYFMAFEIIYPLCKQRETMKDKVIISFLNNLIISKRNNLTEENFFFIVSSLLSAKIFKHDAYKLYYDFVRANSQKIQIKYVILVAKRILLETFPMEGDSKWQHHFCNNTLGEHNCCDDVAIPNILQLLCEIVLLDINWLSNFRFFKEVLHIYFERYENYFPLWDQFNRFVFAYFSKISGCENRVSVNILIMLINCMANFYHTISKYYNQTRKKNSSFAVRKKQHVIANEEGNTDADYTRFDEELKNDQRSIPFIRTDICNEGAEDVRHLKKELRDWVQKLLHALYNNKMKGKTWDQIRLSSRDIIDIFISLRKVKCRDENFLNTLSTIYIYDIFTKKRFVKMEYQIQFFNTIVCLDYLKEVDIMFKDMNVYKRVGTQQEEVYVGQYNHTFQVHHILYTHFLNLPIGAIYLSNISTYLLNVLSLLNTMGTQLQYRICRKMIHLIHSLLKWYYPHDPNDPHTESNPLDRRNIFLLFLSLTLDGYPIHISSFPLASLKIFYNNFILCDFSTHTSEIHSSSMHRSISEYIISFLRTCPGEWEIHSEKRVHSFNVDMLLSGRVPGGSVEAPLAKSVSTFAQNTLRT